MEHILLLTGTLARKSLERIMESVQAEEFSYEIQTLPFAVTALMTTDMISKDLPILFGQEHQLPELSQYDAII